MKDRRQFALILVIAATVIVAIYLIVKNQKPAAVRVPTFLGGAYGGSIISGAATTYTDPEEVVIEPPAEPGPVITIPPELVAVLPTDISVVSHGTATKEGEIIPLPGGPEEGLGEITGTPSAIAMMPADVYLEPERTAVYTTTLAGIVPADS